MSERKGQLLDPVALIAKARRRRRRMSPFQRADEDYLKDQLFATGGAALERRLAQASLQPEAAARRFARRRMQALAHARTRRCATHFQAILATSRPHAHTRESSNRQPVRRRGSRRVTARSSGPPGDDDPGGESEPPGLGHIGWRSAPKTFFTKSFGFSRRPLAVCQHQFGWSGFHRQTAASAALHERRAVR